MSRTFVVGHYDSLEARTMSIIQATTPHAAALRFLDACYDTGQEILEGTGRQEQPWTDPADRLFSIWSFATNFSGQRVWVYEQIGGFDKPMNDLRSWGQA